MKERTKPIAALWAIAATGISACGAPVDDVGEIDDPNSIAHVAPDTEVELTRQAVTTVENVESELTSHLAVFVEAASYYSKAKTVLEVGRIFAEKIGLIKTESIDDKLELIEQKLAALIGDAAVSNLMAEVVPHLSALKSAANELIQYQRNIDRGIPNPSDFRARFQRDYEALTKTALQSLADYASARPAHSVEGRWADVDKNPPKIGNLVYDWRIALPSLLAGLAYRVQVVAFLYPDFRTDRTFDVEFESIRAGLLRHYDLMVRSVRCGVLRSELLTVGCRDLASGTSQIAGRLSARTDLANTVFRGMPAFETRRALDVLALYITGQPDIPATAQGLSPWQAPNLCLAIADTNQNAKVSLKPCAQVGEQLFVYDRETGRITNAFTNKCLEPLSGGFEETVFGGDINHPVRSPAPGNGANVGIRTCEYTLVNGARVYTPRQRWTWDPLSGVFQNGLGPYTQPPGNEVSSGASELGPTLAVLGNVASGVDVGTGIRASGDTRQAWGQVDLLPDVSQFFPWSLETGVDRPGMDLRASSQPTATACRARCATNAACRAFTFVAADRGSGTCYEKYAVPSAVFNRSLVPGTPVPRMVSGIVNPGFEGNTDRYGQDYRWFAGSAYTCRDACTSDSRCTAFTSYAGWCYLKSGALPGATRLVGATSGFKVARSIF